MVLNKDIIELIISRAASGSLPGARTDDRHLALAIEGGGMRGVVSAGMVVALEEMGFRNCFDSVFGASAGAIIAAYFVAGQAHYGSDIFYDHINNHDFINSRRHFAGKPVVSLDYLMRVCTEDRPLDTNAVLASDITLHIVASEIRNRRSVTLSKFADADELFTAMTASACMPVLAGDPIRIKRQFYVDASLYQAIPFESALEAGATDILVLLTRPKGNIQEKPSITERKIVAAKLMAYSEPVYEDYLTQDVRYKGQLEALAGNDQKTVGSMTIQTDANAPLVGTLETRRENLLKAAATGYEAAYMALSQPQPDNGVFAKLSDVAFRSPSPPHALATGMHP